MKNTNYFCMNCKKTASEERTPCPNCGCKKRHIEHRLTESISVHWQIIGKVKGLFKKKPRLEFKKGDDLYKKTGEWNFIDRIIDRTNYWYKKIIKDKKGNIIIKVEKSLKKHQGHGSAKYKKK